MTQMLAIYSQHCDVLAAVINFALRILAVPSAARTLTTLAVIWVYILVAGALRRRSGPGTSPRSCSLPSSSDARARLCTVRTDYIPKIRFSATLGEEPEAQVGPVWPLRAGNLLTESTKKQCSSQIGFPPAPG